MVRGGLMASEDSKSKNGKLLIIIVLVVLVGVILLQSKVVQTLDKEYSADVSKKSILPNASEWDDSWSKACQEMNHGQFAKAEDLVKEALQEAKKKGFKDTRLAAGNDCLALIYKSQGKLEEAWPLYEKNLAIDEASLGKNNPGLIAGLKNVALYKISKKDYAKAAEYYLRAITLAEKEYGSQSPKLAAELRNLIRAYDLQGDYKNAKAVAERALAIDMAAYGANDIVTAIDMNNLALIAFRLNLPEVAFENSAKALSVAEKNKDEVNSKIISLNHKYIANSFEEPFLKGQIDSAVSFPQKAFEEANVLKVTAPDKAAQLLQDNLESARKSSCGTEQLGKYLVRLNNVLFAQGKDFSAIAYGEIARKLLTKNHTAQTLPSLVNVESYLAMSNERQAFKALQEKNFALYRSLTGRSKENYIEAIRLAKEAPSGKISPAWFKTIQTGLSNAELQMKEYEKAISSVKGKNKTSI